MRGDAAYFFFSKQYLCTFTKKKDSCTGDSGGPLFLTENGRFVTYRIVKLNSDRQENQLHFYYLIRKTQIGVVHRGTGTDPICGNPDAPALYMRVTSFKKWIQKHTNNTALDSNCRTDS